MLQKTFSQGLSIFYIIRFSICKDQTYYTAIPYVLSIERKKPSDSSASHDAMPNF